MAIIFEAEDKETSELYTIKKVSIDDKAGITIFTSNPKDVEPILEVFNFVSITSCERGGFLKSEASGRTNVLLQGTDFPHALRSIANSSDPFMSSTLTQKINDYLDKLEKDHAANEASQESVSSPKAVKVTTPRRESNKENDTPNVPSDEDTPTVSPCC